MAAQNMLRAHRYDADPAKVTTSSAVSPVRKSSVLLEKLKSPSTWPNYAVFQVNLEPPAVAEELTKLNAAHGESSIIKQLTKSGTANVREEDDDSDSSECFTSELIPPRELAFIKKMRAQSRRSSGPVLQPKRASKPTPSATNWVEPKTMAINDFALVTFAPVSSYTKQINPSEDRQSRYCSSDFPLKPAVGVIAVQRGLLRAGMVPAPPRAHEAGRVLTSIPNVAEPIHIVIESWCKRQMSPMRQSPQTAPQQQQSATISRRKSATWEQFQDQPIPTTNRTVSEDIASTFDYGKIRGAKNLPSSASPSFESRITGVVNLMNDEKPRVPVVKKRLKKRELNAWAPNSL